jgi:hypothetical protein
MTVFMLHSINVHRDEKIGFLVVQFNYSLFIIIFFILTSTHIFILETEQITIVLFTWQQPLFN